MIALLAWPVVALVLFATLGPWRGAIATYLGGYVLLTSLVSIPMVGLPDYTKFTAIDLGALAGVLLFDARSLAAFRPRWFDLPALALCLIPGASILANGLPPWEGVSAVSGMVLPWGVPYFVARLYARRPEASRDLACGLVIAGAATVPMIAFEVFGQRSFSAVLYGMGKSTGYKYGLYSPVIMMTNSLELAMWMALSGVSGFMLWCTKSVDRLAGWPIGYWAIATVGGTLLCHQTGGIGLLGLGIFLIAVIAGRDRLGKLPVYAATGAVLAVAPKIGGRLTLIAALGIALILHLRTHRPRLIVYGLIASAPMYVLVRTTEVVPRKALTVAAYTLLGGERGYSLEYRMINEEPMIKHTMARPLLGWGTFAGGRARGGRDIILDGYWIILFSLNGFAGLAAFLALLGLPQAAALRRSPVADWSDPAHAPTGALTLCLGLFGIDTLLNAYTSLPIVPLAAGTLIALPSGLRGRSSAIPSPLIADRGLEEVDRLAARGRLVEAEDACRRLIAVRSADRSGRSGLADAYDRLADLLDVSGRLPEAETPRRRAIALRESLLDESPDAIGLRRALAEGGERLARNLAGRGAIGRSAEARGRTLQLRADLAAASPDDPAARSAYADALNDLAWLLTMAPEPADRDPRRAVALAERAVRTNPDRKTYWNTLGAAYQRSGDPVSALAALRQSLRLGPDESGFDHALLALAHLSIGDDQAARDARRRLDAILGDGRPRPDSMRGLVEEANRNSIRSLAR